MKRRLALVAVLAALHAGPARAGVGRVFEVPQVRLPAAFAAPAALHIAGVVPALPVSAALPQPPLLPSAAILPPSAPAPSVAPVLKDSPSLRSSAAGTLGALQASSLDGAAAARPEASEGAASSLAGKSFDGSAAGSGSDGGVPGGAAGPSLPSYLDAPDPEHAAWIAQVLAEAQRSKTARAVLARVKRLAEERGRPVIVLVAPIGNAGEYAFDHEIVTMDSGYMKGPPLEAAPVFLHELAHVLQLAQKLPADAFEMELEAYLTQFRVADEMGYRPKRGTFHWSAYRRFKNDVDRFMAWLLKEYDGNLAITGKGSIEEYAAQLEERHAEALAKLERLEKRADSKRRVIERMAQTNQPAPLIEQYRLDELAPLEEKLRVAKRELGWLERDLLLLRTPEDAERYQRYAERVLKRARAYHARLAAE